MKLVTGYLCALSVLLATSHGVQAAAGDIEQKTYTLNLTHPDKPMKLDVELRNGNVKVEGYNGKTVEITASFSPLSDEQLEEIRERTRQHRTERDKIRPDKPARPVDGLKRINNALYSLEIEESDNDVEITSEASTYSVDLHIRVPKTASAEIELYRGREVRVSNLSGVLELETWQGNIIATNISGPVVAETHRFDIEVSFSSLSAEAPSSLTTYNGDIDVTLARDIKSDIHVKNYKGEILSGLEAAFKPSETFQRKDKKNKQEIVLGGQVSAKYNGGGQALSLNTYDGNVYLRKGG